MAAGVAARAFDNFHAGGSGNVRDHSEWCLLTFEHRTLLDVQLDERFVIAVWQLHFIEISAQSCIAANVLYSFSVIIVQPLGGFDREASAEQPAAEASNAKAGRLFRSENQ